MSESEKIENIKNKFCFIRSGECKRCGKCCYVWKGSDKIGIERSPCEHLEFNESGLAVCKLGDDKSEGCKEFPMRPIAIGYDKEYFKDCGYSFKLRTDVTKEELLDNLEYICSLCEQSDEKKEICSKKQELINIIKRA